MRTLTTSGPGALLALALLALPVAAQESPVATRAELDAALASEAARADADRAVVSRVLALPEVEEAARGADLAPELDRVRDAVPLLDAPTLATAAEYAAAIEVQLAGGQSIVITATTLILILLLVIIIVLIAD